MPRGSTMSFRLGEAAFDAPLPARKAGEFGAPGVVQNFNTAEVPRISAAPQRGRPAIARAVATALPQQFLLVSRMNISLIFRSAAECIWSPRFSFSSRFRFFLLLGATRLRDDQENSTKYTRYAEDTDISEAYHENAEGT